MLIELSLDDRFEREKEKRAEFPGKRNRVDLLSPGDKHANLIDTFMSFVSCFFFVFAD